MYVYDLGNNKTAKVRISKIEDTISIDPKVFSFNWNKEEKYEMYQLTLKKSNEVLGIVSFIRIFEELRTELRLLEISKHNIGKNKQYDRIAGILIAFVCKESFLSGFYGFVSLIPKTKLIEHYKSKYGFKEFGKHLVVELESSENLITKYLNDEV